MIELLAVGFFEGTNLIWIIGTLLGIPGTIITAIAMYRKTKPEVSQIIATAAGDVVILQKGLLDRTLEQLKAAQDKIAVQEKKIEELEGEVTKLRRLLREESEHGTAMDERLKKLEP